MLDAFTADVLPRAKTRHFKHVFRDSIFLLLVTFLLVSCAARRAMPAAPVPLARAGAASPLSVAPSSPATSDSIHQHRIGIVRVIGSGQRFVLIEVPAAGVGSLPDGQILCCSPAAAVDSATTATLRVARERRRPFIVADVTAGSPRIGDNVFVVSNPLPTPGAPIVLPTATAGVLPIILPAPRANPKSP